MLSGSSQHIHKFSGSDTVKSQFCRRLGEDMELLTGLHEIGVCMLDDLISYV